MKSKRQYIEERDFEKSRGNAYAEVAARLVAAEDAYDRALMDLQLLLSTEDQNV